MVNNGFIVVNIKKKKISWGEIREEFILEAPNDNMFFNANIKGELKRAFIFKKREEAEEFIKARRNPDLFNLEIRENMYQDIQICPECRGESIIPIMECNLCDHKGYIYVMKEAKNSIMDHSQEIEKSIQ